jgi:hypothetical protein
MERIRNRDVVTVAGSVDLAVAGEVTIRSKPFMTAYGSNFGLEYIITAGTAPDLKIELEQSTKEDAADAMWSVPKLSLDIETSLTVSTVNHKAVTPSPFEWSRLKITGNVGNSANTVLRANISVQEQF